MLKQAVDKTTGIFLLLDSNPLVLADPSVDRLNVPPNISASMQSEQFDTGSVKEEVTDDSSIT